MILADSIGFAATHTISHILSGIPDAEVSHGSRNFAEKTPVGRSDMTAQGFVDAMARSEAEGRRTYAVHCLFNPREGVAACARAGGTHKVIVRAPRRQIRSCFSWMVGKALGGDPILFGRLVAAERQFLSQLPVASNLSNALFVTAAVHVVEYNLAAMGEGCEILQMEKLVADEGYFRDAFEVPEEVELEHFQGGRVHRASHKSRIEEMDLAEPDEEALLSALVWTLDGKQLQLPDVARALGYA